MSAQLYKSRTYVVHFSITCECDPAHHHDCGHVRAGRRRAVAAFVFYRLAIAPAAARAESGGAGRCAGGVCLCAAGRLRRARPAHTVYVDGGGAGAVAGAHHQHHPRAVPGAGRGAAARSLGRAVARLLAVVRRRRHHFVCDGGPHGGSLAGAGQPLAPPACHGSAGRAHAICGDGGAAAFEHAAVFASVAGQPRGQCAGYSRHQPDRHALGAGGQPAAGAAVRLDAAAGPCHRADAGASAGMAGCAPLCRVDGARATGVEFLLGTVRHGMAAGATRMAAALGRHAGLAAAADGLAVESAAGQAVGDGL